MCSENSPAGATSVSTRWQSNPPNTADSVADGGPRRHPRRATMLCILGISTPADFDSSFAPVEYTLSSLPPKLLMANKRPPPDAVIDGHAAKQRCQITSARSSFQTSVWSPTILRNWSSDGLIMWEHGKRRCAATRASRMWSTGWVRCTTSGESRGA